MADDESLDHDIDQELEPTPFISKALIGRFLAVGVFVALGTFAVIQSVSAKKDVVDDHEGHDHSVIQSVGAQVGETVAAVGDKTKKGLDDFLGGAKNAASSTAASVKDKVTSVTSGFGIGSSKPSSVKAPTKPAASFSASSGNSFSTRSKPTALATNQLAQSHWSIQSLKRLRQVLREVSDLPA